MAPRVPDKAMDLKKIRQRLAELEARSVKSNPRATKSKPTRKQRKQRAGTKMVQGLGAGGFSNLPVARSFANSRSARFDTRALPRHATYGQGVYITGCEVGLNIVTAAATADFFTGSVATASTVNVFNVSPDTMNGRLALVARTYARYRFRRLVVHFIPALGTANPGLAAIGYVPDGGQSVAAAQSFAQTTQCDPSIVFSLNAPMSVELIRYNGSELYYVETDATSLAGNRLTLQGQIFGFPSANNLGVLTQGVLWFEYEIELYTPTTDYGFTMTRQEQLLAERFIASRRQKVEHGDDEYDSVSVASSRRGR